VEDILRSSGIVLRQVRSLLRYATLVPQPTEQTVGRKTTAHWFLFKPVMSTSGFQPSSYRVI
jgi:hypothetical protein